MFSSIAASSSSSSIGEAKTSFSSGLGHHAPRVCENTRDILSRFGEARQVSPKITYRVNRPVRSVDPGHHFFNVEYFQSFYFLLVVVTGKKRKHPAGWMDLCFPQPESYPLLTRGCEQDAMDSCAIQVVTDDRAFIVDAVNVQAPGAPSLCQVFFCPYRVKGASPGR